MENASKALIIAGAILLAIAIIGIGMYVFSVAQSGAGEVDMTAEQATSYNAKFISYEGVKRGTSVKSMLDTIRTHNIANKDDTTKQILVNGMPNGTVTSAFVNNAATNCAQTTDDVANGSAVATINSIKEKVNEGTRYIISVGYTTTGLVKRINIQIVTNN